MNEIEQRRRGETGGERVDWRERRGEEREREREKKLERRGK